MTGPSLKLYFTPGSPFARKVRIVLAEKALPFKAEDVTDQFRQGEAYAAINPNLQVPVLEDGDLRLFESNLIMDYLLKTYPGQEPPGAASGEAPGAPPPLAASLTRPEHHWEDSKILATLDTMAGSMVNLRQLGLSGVRAEQVDYLKRQQNRIQYCLDWLEERATPEGFAPGSFSIMDINLICHLDFAAVRQIFDRGRRPSLEGILAHHRQRPSVKTTEPEPLP